jgi:hypothetical protein
LLNIGYDTINAAVGTSSLTQSILDDTWHHITVVADPQNKQLKLYIDGILLKAVSLSSTTKFEINWDNFQLNGYKVNTEKGIEI